MFKTLKEFNELDSAAIVAAYDFERPGFFARIKEAIAAWLLRRKEKADKEKAEMLKDRFDIRERGGRLFVTCDGVAVMEIPASYSAADIVNSLQENRKDALAYANLRK